MAKIALLIGVSEYGKGLSGLPGTKGDLEKMRIALENPQVGGFDQVKVLPDPNRDEMESAIETVLTENRSAEDLILIYFAGHGVRDENGTLYFATRITETNDQGRIRVATALRASVVQDYMSQSRSQRQILILDCCFSGAFANDMTARKAEVIPVDINLQLGGEGRAVLTSSTATQFAYEQEGGGIYTRYLVEGLETGAADRDGDGQITVDELHEYAREKVREAAPSMQPEIYAVREGYKIFVARAPQDDPRLIYRKELDDRAKRKQGKLSAIERRALNYRGRELGLSPQEAEQIASEVLQPYQVFWEKLNEFEQAVKELLEETTQPCKSDFDDLRYLQQTLKLRDEDIFLILNTYDLNIILLQSPSRSFSAVQGVEGKQADSNASTKSGQKQEIEPDYISSEETVNSGKEIEYGQDDTTSSLLSRVDSPFYLKNSDIESFKRFLQESQSIGSYQGWKNTKSASEEELNYARLEELLIAKKWQEADVETHLLMMQALGKIGEDQFSSEELSRFPCQSLKTINNLWVSHSSSKFGFSIQNRIYLESGGKPTAKKVDSEIWEKFSERTGWFAGYGEIISYSEAVFDASAPIGHLPFGVFLWGLNLRGEGISIYMDLGGDFFSLISACRL